MTTSEQSEIIKSVKEYVATEDRTFSSHYRLQLPYTLLKQVPQDPCSEEYRAFQFDLYSVIAERKYDPVTSEGRIEVSMNDVYPYATRNIRTIGDELISMGDIIRNLGTNVPAKILEIGPGSGTLTLELAKSGFDVTGLEICKQSCNIIETRAKQLGLNIHTINQDMIEFAKSYNKQDFDIVLTYKSFHHCWDHVNFLSNVKNILKPNGKIILTAEPITTDINILPYPWGIRLDAEAIFVTHTQGWLEFGFHPRYLSDTFAKYGFSIEFRNSGYTHLSSIVIGTMNKE